MKKIFLIGEIGINHNGDIEIAKKLIENAKIAGFDAIKFQKRDPVITTPDNIKNQPRSTPWGNTTYFEYKKKIEFKKKHFDKIDRFCKKIKIQWFASPWDLESNKFLKQYKLKYNKVASAMLTNLKLLEEISKQKRYTFISTGMSTEKDIKKAIKIFRKNRCKFMLMHCVSSYPAKDNQLNLNYIKTMRKKFKCDVGYSGHEISVSPSLMAACLGAQAIERHITLDRTMWGTDQSASLELNGMKLLVEFIRKFEECQGSGIKKFNDLEKKMLKKFKYW